MHRSLTIHTFFVKSASLMRHFSLIFVLSTNNNDNNVLLFIVKPIAKSSRLEFWHRIGREENF